ncbi:MAG: UvrD-helicase domain-containing protein [Burkholderiaceae bacterium]
MSLIATRQVRARTLKNAEPPSHPFFDHAQALLDAFERRDEATERMRLQLIRALLSEGGEALRRAKRKRRVLAFDDLLSSLHRALAGPMGPALAASLRERFPCALIDEFQDTDALQFEIFRRLFAPRGATPGASGTLILVGDPKQAIYGFRQADVHVYLGARELADDVHSLARNQRAVPSLIAAVNAVFSSNPAAFVLPALEFLPATPGTRERPGLLDASGGPREAMQILTLPRDESGRCIDRQSALSMAARATAAEVARLLDAGTRGEIRVGPAPLAAGHIAVLVRTRRQAATVREEMTRWGIDTIEVSQQSVFATDDARQLEAVLRAVAEPTRLAVVLSALASTLIGLDAIEIEALQRDELALGAHVEAFVAMREDWVERGIGAMLRGWITRER